jgi:hypothetical protein
MHRAIPCINEHVNELKQHLQHEHDGHKKPRLQMLYLLASGHARTCQEVAHLLGVHRNTIGRPAPWVSASICAAPIVQRRMRHAAGPWPVCSHILVRAGSRNGRKLLHRGEQHGDMSGWSFWPGKVLRT